MTIWAGSLYVQSELSDATTDEAHLEALGWSGAPRALFLCGYGGSPARKRHHSPTTARGVLRHRLSRWSNAPSLGERGVGSCPVARRSAAYQEDGVTHDDPGCGVSQLFFRNAKGTTKGSETVTDSVERVVDLVGQRAHGAYSRQRQQGGDQGIFDQVLPSVFLPKISQEPFSVHASHLSISNRPRILLRAVTGNPNILKSETLPRKSHRGGNGVTGVLFAARKLSPSSFVWLRHRSNLSGHEACSPCRRGLYRLAALMERCAFPVPAFCNSIFSCRFEQSYNEPDGAPERE